MQTSVYVMVVNEEGEVQDSLEEFDLNSDQNTYGQIKQRVEETYNKQGYRLVSINSGEYFGHPEAVDIRYDGIDSRSHEHAHNYARVYVIPKYGVSPVGYQYNTV